MTKIRHLYPIANNPATLEKFFAGKPITIKQTGYLPSVDPEGYYERLTFLHSLGEVAIAGWHRHRTVRFGKDTDQRDLVLVATTDAMHALWVAESVAHTVEGVTTMTNDAFFGRLDTLMDMAGDKTSLIVKFIKLVPHTLYPMGTVYQGLLELPDVPDKFFSFQFASVINYRDHSDTAFGRVMQEDADRLAYIIAAVRRGVEVVPE